jgi:hypothetical protein
MMLKAVSPEGGKVSLGASTTTGGLSGMRMRAPGLTAFTAVRGAVFAEGGWG